MMQPHFRHRSYLGWITDLASHPYPDAAWPVVGLEDWLVADYETTFQRMAATGMNEIVIWGLFTGNAWPVDIESAVDRERGARLERLLSYANDFGIRVVSGVGLYSWGFDEIIRAHPELARSNPRAMCASNSAAWEWQKGVFDFVFSWGIGGVSMQSADQGRCQCAECDQLGNVEYHARLNGRAGDYIRSMWPDATIGVNSWGLRFDDPADASHLIELSRHVDYIIDAHDSALTAGRDYRRTLISDLDCDWGTIGGWSPEPPQHWQRERWFLPCLAEAAHSINALRDDGGRACELYFRILANPGDEVSFETCSRLLSEDTRAWEGCLRDALTALYQPVDAAALDDLQLLFLTAEAGFFSNARLLDRPGTISLEPLVSNSAGDPIYLIHRFDFSGLDRYRAALMKSREIAGALSGRTNAQGRLDAIERCIENVLQDIALAESQRVE